MNVAVALIKNATNHLLITQRPLHVDHGGCWEFPGGKLEEGELPEQALVREIKEELGIQIEKHQYLGAIHHPYPQKEVQLFAFLVTEFSGVPQCLEGQLNYKWIAPQDLNPDEFPEANRKLLQWTR